MSKTKKDSLYNTLRREEKKRNTRTDHTRELKEKRAKNALRSNNVDVLLSFDEYFG